jgi:hypothetical protein
VPIVRVFFELGAFYFAASISIYKKLSKFGNYDIGSGCMTKEIGYHNAQALSSTFFQFYEMRRGLRVGWKLIATLCFPPANHYSIDMIPYEA